MSGSGSPDGHHGSRRRRHRSRSRHRRHHRREHRSSGQTQVKVEEGAPAAADPRAPPPAYSYPPSPWPPGARPDGPPAGWHGSAGGGLPAPGPAGPPGHPGYGMHPPPLHPLHAGDPRGPPPFGHGPPPMGMPLHGAQGARSDPYASSSPFAAVPPPPNLDDGGYRKGRGKGHYGRSEHDFEAHAPQPDGLIVSNVPAELNSLDVLNRHFKQFGEVLKITVSAGEGRAFVQFAEQSSAQAAAAAPMMDKPEITLALARRGDKGKGKEKVKGKDRPTHLDKPAEHRVLCSNPEAQRQHEENMRKKAVVDDIANRRNKLLAAYTEQIQVIMAKLSAPDMDEAKREVMRKMILQIKEKMNALNAQEFGGFEEAGKGKASKRSKGEGEGKGGGDGKGGKGEKDGRWTLDLRPKVLRVNLTQGFSQDRLREELAKLGAGEEKIVCLHMESSSSSGSVPETEDTKNLTALVQFRDRRGAEQVFNSLKESKEQPFSAEWTDQVPPGQATTSTSPALQPAAAPDALAGGIPADAVKAEELSTAADGAIAPTLAAAATASSPGAADGIAASATEGPAATATEGTAAPATEAAAATAGAAAPAVADAAPVAKEGSEATATDGAQADLRVDLSEEEDEPAGN